MLVWLFLSMDYLVSAIYVFTAAWEWLLFLAAWF